MSYFREQYSRDFEHRSPDLWSDEEIQQYLFESSMPEEDYEELDFTSTME